LSAKQQFSAGESRRLLRLKFKSRSGSSSNQKTTAMRALLFLVLLSFTVCTTAQAQRETQGTRWWYGAHVNLGFSASQNSSLFSFGLSPMAGYKILPGLSIGPRVKAIFSSYRVRDLFGTAASKGVLDYGLGTFLRVNVYQGFFAQGEFGYENNGQVFFTGTELFVQRNSGLNAFVGAGYNSGQGSRLAYEVMLAYDLNLLNTNTLALLNYRVGFTLFY